MELPQEVRQNIIDSILADNNCKMDGRRRNILFSYCPYCGHENYKFGIYVGQSTKSKAFGT